MGFEKDFLRKLYGHCDDETFAKFFSTYITDPVLGLLRDEEKARDFLSLRGWLTFFSIICGIVGILCVSLNFLLITYYFPRRNHVMPSLYLTLVSCDLLTGIAAMTTSITLGYLLRTTTYQNHALILASYTTNSFTCRFSTWISLILVVARTVSIVKPHVTLKRCHVMPVISVCFMMTVVLIYLDDLAERDVKGTSIWHRVRFNLVFNMSGRRVLLYLGRKTCQVFSHAVIWTFCVILPFVIPALISLLAMLVQIYFMSTSGGAANRKSKTNRKITVTILLLTSVYVLVNTLYFITTIIFLYLVQDMTPTMSLALFITSTVLPYLNALVNPIIMVSRGRRIRDHVMRLVTCRGGVGRGATVSPRVSASVVVTSEMQ